MVVPLSARRVALVSLLLAIVLLTACRAGRDEEPTRTVLSSTPRPVTATIAPTPSPTVIAPPTPSAHQWKAPTVLVQTFMSPGFEGSPSRLPDVVLYSDGTLFLANHYHDPDYWLRARPTVGRLSEAQLCRFLYDLEGTGFYSFTRRDYIEPDFTDGGVTTIKVNGWESREFRLYAFSPHYYDEPKANAGLRSLIAGATLIENLSAPEMQRYRAERLILKITEVEDDDYSNYLDETWPLATPVADLLAAERTGYPVIEGEDVQKLTTVLGDRLEWLFSDGDKYYWIAAYITLPHQLEDQRPTEWNGMEPLFHAVPRTVTCTPEGTAPVPYATPTAPPWDYATPALPDPFESLGIIGKQDDPDQVISDGLGTSPRGLLVTIQNEVILADNGNQRLLWFSPDGQLSAPHRCPPLRWSQRPHRAGTDGSTC